MLLVTSQPTGSCESYPRARSKRMKSTNINWSFSRDQFTTGVPQQRKKSVHFADAKGLALTSTFFFAKDDFSPQDYRSKIIAYCNYNRTAIGQCAKLLNFKSPVPRAHFVERLCKDNVCLEKTYCNRSGIYGRIQVKNLAYEKAVCVRYTADSWRTFHDQKANYIPGSSTGGADTFFFHIKPPQAQHDMKVELAIRYKVDGGEFWDNNYGDNYRLVYLYSDKTDI